VTFLSRSADEQTRTFRVEITVPNPDVTIRDGQTADILIQTAGTSGASSADLGHDAER
jgi:multidrug efflux system membrane fusion protein